jgi:molecular chaperone DnaJ
MKNYYSILELPEDADEISIRRQFIKLAKLYHPDKNNFSEKESFEKFININESYKILSDTEKRKKYDEKLKELKELKFEENKKITSYRSRIRDGGDINVELSVIKNEISGEIYIDKTDYEFEKQGYGEKRDNCFVNSFYRSDGGNYSLKSNSGDFACEQNENSIQQAKYLTRNEIYKKIEYERFIVCPDCNGSGREKNTKIIPCENCNTTGIIKNKQTGTLDICDNCDGYGDIILYKCKTCGGKSRIKKLFKAFFEFDKSNLKNDSRIIFKSMGDSGAFEGTNGNLIVNVQIENVDSKKSKDNNKKNDKKNNIKHMFNDLFKFKK